LRRPRYHSWPALESLNVQIEIQNVDFHTIVKIESGKTSNSTIDTVDTVKKISNALGTTIDNLIRK